VTESYFCRFFKSSTGMTLTQYLLEFRIKKAQVLLTQTDDPVARIAENVGIPDANYFSRVFRKSTGMSPAQFRRTGRL